MKIWIGVTDGDWFKFLRNRNPDEVNFWQPSSGRAFRILTPGEPFLFKLHSPRNYVVGGGFFVRHTALPCSLAWQAFREKNGVPDLSSFYKRIWKYRRTDKVEADPKIGCSILTEPFFWRDHEWIRVPSDWAANIVQGKSYETADQIGAQLWNDVLDRQRSQWRQSEIRDDEPRYGAEYLRRARLGQGAFRVLVTEAYGKRCAITGERTLPVLEAAHIQPFALEGPNRVANGLLLRSDLHILFDCGYLTVQPNRQIEVSRRIREEFENGREYYAFHGKTLVILPQDKEDRPGSEFLRWHNDWVYEQEGRRFSSPIPGD